MCGTFFSLFIACIILIYNFHSDCILTWKAMVNLAYKHNINSNEILGKKKN
jgi:hypothetical protein